MNLISSCTEKLILISADIILRIFHNIPASSEIKNVLIYFIISLSWDSDNISLYLLSVFISCIFVLLKNNEFQGRDAFCSLLGFLPALNSFPAFSFASSPPLNPMYFIHDHYLLHWMNTFLYYLKRLQRKSVKVWVFIKKKKRKKKPRAWPKLYNDFFFLNSLFLASHLCVTCKHRALWQEL